MPARRIGQLAFNPLHNPIKEHYLLARILDNNGERLPTAQMLQPHIQATALLIDIPLTHHQRTHIHKLIPRNLREPAFDPRLSFIDFVGDVKAVQGEAERWGGDDQLHILQLCEVESQALALFDVLGAARDGLAQWEELAAGASEAVRDGDRGGVVDGFYRDEELVARGVVHYLWGDCQVDVVGGNGVCVHWNPFLYWCDIVIVHPLHMLHSHRKLHFSRQQYPTVHHRIRLDRKSMGDSLVKCHHLANQ